ncbi:MAG: thiol-disulfide isomerase/thioredoxin [Oceanicoccus sp.]|jgi:thiol-disulfide isomerase/thioredoxin
MTNYLTASKWLRPLFICLLLTACGKTDFVTATGNSGNFSDYQGQWIVINYWAIWCKPCIEEIPELNKLASENSKRLVVFGVDFDQSQGQKLAQAIDKLGISFPVLQKNPAALLNIEPPKVLPTTLLINPQGQVTHTLVGPQTEASILRLMHL